MSNGSNKTRRLLHVQLLSSKDRVAITIEGKHVCLILFNTVISLAVVRLLIPLVKVVPVAFMLL